MVKRGNGEGTISRRSDGRWSARLSYMDDEGVGRRAQFYGRTQVEARAKMAEARQRLASGAPVRDATITLGAYASRWIQTTLAASGRKASTRATYSTLARLHVIGGAVGAQRLDRLKPTDVEAMVLDMRAAGKAPSTIRQTYTILRAILDAAVRDGLLGRNVAAAVTRPGVPRTEAAFLEPAALRRLLVETDKSPRYGVLFRLLASTGLRRGEGLALRWVDVDLDEGSLRVTATLGRVGDRLEVTEPKTGRSRRSVPLAPAVVAMLREHKRAQNAERLAAGPAWTDLGIVFATEGGTYLDPRNALRALAKAAKAAGLEGVGVHTLRHSAATMMLSAGAPLTDVSAVLGHASVAITGDVYGHLTAGGARSAIDRIAAALA